VLVYHLFTCDNVPLSRQLFIHKTYRKNWKWIKNSYFKLILDLKKWQDFPQWVIARDTLKKYKMKLSEWKNCSLNMSVQNRPQKVTSFKGNNSGWTFFQIHVSLVNGRPGASGPSRTLSDFTLARFVRIRLRRLRVLPPDLVIML